MTPVALTFGTRRPYRAYRASRLRRAVIAACVLALAGGSAVALVLANRSQATAGYWTYRKPVIADTAYAVPGGAVFVSPSGRDSNPGTQSAPLATVAHAVAKVGSGGTIVLRGGTYREQLGSITKRITIQPYPHEQAWLKGSLIATGFSGSGGDWVKSGWNPAGVCHNCYPQAAIDPQYPMAGQPDQVFIDGAPQRQVSSRSAVGNGSFYFDRAHSQLWIGTNPTGHTIEATAYAKAMQFSTSHSSGSIVRGIGIADYAAHYNFDVPAMVVGNTSNLTFVKDTFAFSAGRGLSILSPGAVVTDDMFVDNGANGLHANTADGLDFERNYVGFNNFERFSIQPSASASTAGAKITSSGNMVLRGNVVEDNYSNGLWLDVSCWNTVIANNTILRNAGHGIAVELSGSVIVAGNISGHNGRIGLKVSGSNAVSAINNTIVNNGWAQLGVYEDPRSNPRPQHGVTWNTAQVVVANNIFEGPNSSTYAMLDSFDGNYPKRTTTQGMLSIDARNVWMRPTVSAPHYVASWQISTKSASRFSNLPSLQSGTHREQASVAADGVSLSAMFVNPGADDYRLTARNPARVGGLALTSAVAAAMGVRTGATPMLGALNAPIG